MDTVTITLYLPSGSVKVYPKARVTAKNYAIGYISFLSQIGEEIESVGLPFLVINP